MTAMGIDRRRIDRRYVRSLLTEARLELARTTEQRVTAEMTSSPDVKLAIKAESYWRGYVAALEEVLR